MENCLSYMRKMHTFNEKCVKGQESRKCLNDIM